MRKTANGKIASYRGVMTPKEHGMNHNKPLLAIIVFALAGCAGITQPIKYQRTDVISKENYLLNKETNGVVLLDVNWGRRWGCGNHENAQLISLAFDKLPMKNIKKEAEPSLVLHSPSRLLVDPVFSNYGFSLKPGEYAISAFSIKVADSMSKVGFLTAKRDKLYKDGKPVGGTFIVKPNETVFIGNFYLDCTYGPTLWRYHSNGKEAFEEQVKQYQNSFPFLDLSEVKFRLFKTNEFGNDYEFVP